MRGLDRMEDDLVEDVFLQEGLRPTIAEHAAQCNSLFRKYMVLPDIVPDPTVMDDQLARFTLWTSNMDVYGPLNVSLDYRLRFSPTVVDIIHQLLDVICDTLASLKPINNDPPPQTPSRKRQRISEYSDSKLTRRDDDDASDSDSDVDQAEENFSKITDTIGGTVSRLFRLSNAVRKSAKTNRALKIERYTDDKEANEKIEELTRYTDCYIKFRFPMAPDSLRLAMMEANALRLRRLYYQRSHRRRIDLTVQNPQTKPPEVQLPKIKESAPAVHFAPSALPKPATTNRTSGQGGAPVVPVTTATTARQTAVGALLAKSVTEVPRAKSVLVNNKLSFPPLPSTPECPYCGVIIEFKNSNKTMMWNNHVIGDLEPFICVFPHCLEAGHNKTGPLTFESSKAWIGHMQNAHGHTWECRAPSHPPRTFDQELDYQKHSIEEHDVPKELAGMLSSAAQRPALNKLLECPFGDDFQPPEKAESSAVFSSDALQLHVAAHIKEIALLTLQKLPSDDDAKSIKSDEGSEDDGQGFANVRRSMYSLLDDEKLDFQHDNSEVADVTGDPREEDIRASVSGLDLEDKDESGMTKLHRAVQAGDQDLVESLIKEGANWSSRDNSGRTALWYSPLGRHQSVHVIFLLLLGAGGKAILNLEDDNGQTLVHHYAGLGHEEAVQILVDIGADISITDRYGFSPLLWAVVAGNEAVVIHLLHAGADVNFISGDGRSVLTWAAGLGRYSIALRLLDQYTGMSKTQDSLGVPLEEAAASGSLDIVKLLLEHGGDPNYRDRDGWSAIHWAAEEGYYGVVKLLLEKGANVNAVSSYGTSPLHCAANGGNTHVVSLLLEYGADPLKSTCHGWTALHHAAFMGHPEVVQLLLGDDRVRSSVSQQDNHGWAATGLRQAVVIGNIPIIRLFIKDASHVNRRDSGRRTALYYAAKKRMLPIIDLLLNSGADPNILPQGRKTWEEFISDKDVLQRLHQAGYQRQDTDPELEGQIRRALRPKGQFSIPDRTVSFAPEVESVTPMSWRPTFPTEPEQSSSSVPVSSTTSVPDHSASSTPVESPAPAPQTNDNKRKSRTVRSRATGFWKRLIG
ncbi:ankyrin repeats (3 copies) domain-containing protein [Trichoderma breve]|uniref:Ankyrin repeats (3 copies) domain-containing protein n=1 Tax=Trichoderma breve TaxID=2034170 RepID=A0A9W9B9J6_9HYPO|nr:ankyrin repeats (3 copies) domain-containing protein [Trichoderma breve]KAJ4855811.1 ankyrin repeats (3 copies) domain-containing protein [Trichoderma breve]